MSDTTKRANKPLTYISLFSCAGVGCYGFKMNNFECVATNELMEVRLNVQKANNKCKKESGYICGDITLSDTQQALFSEISKWKDSENVETIDVVAATPPCQGMSTANYKKTDTEQTRNSLVVEAIKLIKKIRPKVFIFENVRAFLKTICTDIDGKDKQISESILANLSTDYHIYWKIINFKDYGVPSSRPRTIVIGTLKELTHLSPLLLFPTRREEITLRKAIGDFKRLGYGEQDEKDPLHFARTYPIEQLKWIENIREGQSAFEQEEELQPGRLDDNGKKIINKGAYMGNKYRRLVWDKVCSCIHTRNDVMSSQDTIHPSDNRVLSIRELMRVMTIPDSFHWTSSDEELTTNNSADYLKHNELNIRRCIGEAVPTHIMEDISGKIKKYLTIEDRDESSSEIFSNLYGMEAGTKSIVNINVQASDVSDSLIQQIFSLFSDKDNIIFWTKYNLGALSDSATLPSNVIVKHSSCQCAPDYNLDIAGLKECAPTQLSLF